MLFGRKNPPIGSPKSAGSDQDGSAAPDRVAADATAPPAPSVPSAPTPSPTAASYPGASAAASQPATVPGYRSPYSDKGSEMSTSTPKPPASPSLAGVGLRNDTPRRVVDIPGTAPRRDGAPAPAAAPASDQQRRLTVGRDISLSGEITSCDVLVVEGTVEAKLRDGRSIEIADGGLFKGSVEIDEADIGGRFEGDILVRGRLRVRTTGRITGSIKYGELEVEAGGRLIGDIQVVEAGAPNVARMPAPVAAPLPAAAPETAGAAE